MIALLMLQALTPITEPIEHIATVTSKGQITIPVGVRRHLKLDKHRKVAVVVKPDGSVQLAVPKYPTLESIAGVVEPLAKPMTLSEMRAVVADELAEAYRAKSQ
jgi:bifunctional DNA-binding transcriptional regulator/antitoxin component of YhaV-PrlF toxin-antitoxin module